MCPIVKDSFWVMTDEMPLGATIPLESMDEDEHQVYKTLFEDPPKGGEGIAVNPLSILRIMIVRVEVSRSHLHFESKTQESSVL